MEIEFFVKPGEADSRVALDQVETYLAERLDLRSARTAAALPFGD
jgi:hypothetical protein